MWFIVSNLIAGVRVWTHGAIRKRRRGKGYFSHFTWLKGKLTGLGWKDKYTKIEKLYGQNMCQKKK